MGSVQFPSVGAYNLKPSMCILFIRSALGLGKRLCQHCPLHRKDIRVPHPASILTITLKARFCIQSAAVTSFLTHQPVPALRLYNQDINLTAALSKVPSSHGGSRDTRPLVSLAFSLEEDCSLFILRISEFTISAEKTT